MWETDPLAFIACARKYWHKENTPHNLHFFPCVSPGPFSMHMNYKRAVPGLARDVLRDVTLWESSSPGVTAATSTCPAAPTRWQPLLSPSPRSSQLPFLHSLPLLLQNTALCLTEQPPISPVRCYGWTWGSHPSRSLWIAPEAMGGVILLCFKTFPADIGRVLHGGFSSGTDEELTQIFQALWVSYKNVYQVQSSTNPYGLPFLPLTLMLQWWDFTTQYPVRLIACLSNYNHKI